MYSKIMLTISNILLIILLVYAILIHSAFIGGKMNRLEYNKEAPIELEIIPEGELTK